MINISGVFNEIYSSTLAEILWFDDEGFIFVFLLRVFLGRIAVHLSSILVELRFEFCVFYRELVGLREEAVLFRVLPVHFHQSTCQFLLIRYDGYSWEL